MSGAPEAVERRLVRLVGAVVFADTLFYAAIAPLLPELARELRLTKASAGLMTASYPLGTLIGSIPGGVLAVRAGPKRAVYIGLGLMCASTLAFGLLDSVPALDVARFVEGVGGACTWAGGLAWIVAEAPAQRRGALIGGAIGAAIAGTLFGPVIGTVAGAIGRAATFSGLVVLALPLFDQTRRLPDRHLATGQGTWHLMDALKRGPVLAAMWLVVLPSLIAGMLSVLGALRLHRLGFAVAAIGGTLLIGAALASLISPIIGRVSDRRGRWFPLRFGLVFAAVLLACFTLPTAALALAALVVAIDCSLATFWAPSMAMLSDQAAAAGLDQALAAALMNLAWAGGQIVGAGGGGAVAKATGDAVPMACAAVFCALTLVISAGRGRLRNP